MFPFPLVYIFAKRSPFYKMFFSLLLSLWISVSFSGHLLRFFCAGTSFPSWSGVPWREAAGHLHREGRDPRLWAGSFTPASWHSLSLETNSGAPKARPQRECGQSHRARTDPSFHTRTNKCHSVLRFLRVWSQTASLTQKGHLL